jgi:hypothetical protein
MMRHTKPAVTCPVCGDDWDIAEFKCVQTHCAHDAFPPAGHMEKSLLYWCPCGAVWSPGTTEDNGSSRYETAIWDQRPPQGEHLDVLMWEPTTTAAAETGGCEGFNGDGVEKVAAAYRERGFSVSVTVNSIGRYVAQWSKNIQG